MYQTFDLGHGYKIIDEMGDCIYLFEKGDQAFLIDTGMSQEPLGPVVEQLTQRPVSVLLTHGHLDHVARSGEFEKVFLDPQDLSLYSFFADAKEGGEAMNYLPAEKLQKLDPDMLKKAGLEIVACAGHTPGSVLFADLENKVLYTGDAIGSGCGMWLWDDVSFNIPEFRKSLQTCVKQLESLGVDDSWKFYGGHHDQEYMSKTGPFNPINLQMFRDMITLCEKLENGEEIECIEIDPSGLPHAREGLKPFHAIYGKAEMLTAPEKTERKG